MEFTNEEMVKSLTSLIDETLEEIEEIKKSKFAATEISLGDSESGMAGKSKNGELDAKKKEDEDDDEDDKDKDMDKAEDCEKGENEKADPDHGKFAQAPTVSKGENEKADPDHGKFAQAPTVSKKEDDDEDEDKDKDMEKSIQESEDLIKSYVDYRMDSLEEKLSKMAAAIEALADAPVERKGVPSGVAPLHKSVEEVEPLSKTEVASKLFELKKSGEEVDSADIFRVETGNQATAVEIANKYGLR
jgi:hypothetical protein